MWGHTHYETSIAKKLKKELDPEGEALFARYVHAKHQLRTVWESIVGTERMLTDHGPAHIQNVLKNTEKLLDSRHFSGVELYSLAMMVLFHDVGNIFGRTDHEKRIEEVYNEIMAGSGARQDERLIVVRGAGAHSGIAQDGSRDTLQDVPTTLPLAGQVVRLQELAAVLRFADELAEGPQRTSEFMAKVGGYDDASQIYHTYARITHVTIDRFRKQIFLLYTFDLPVLQGSIHLPSVERLLSFVFSRILKLDYERQYNKHFTNALAPFEMTAVGMDFCINGLSRDLGLKPLILKDHVPEITGKSKELRQVDPAYDVQALLARLQESSSSGVQPGTFPADRTPKEPRAARNARVQSAGKKSGQNDVKPVTGDPITYKEVFAEQVQGQLIARFKLDSNLRPIWEPQPDYPDWRVYTIFLFLETPRAQEIKGVKYKIEDDTFNDPYAYSEKKDKKFRARITSAGDVPIVVTVKMNKQKYKQQAWLSDMLENGHAGDPAPAVRKALNYIGKN